MKIKLTVQSIVAVYSVLAVFLFTLFSWGFDVIVNKPVIKNGIQIIHAGIEYKEKF